MELITLGFDQWFQDKESEARRPDCNAARVTAVDRDSYLVRNENREIFAEPAGSFLYSVESGMDLPSVGDWCSYGITTPIRLPSFMAFFPAKRSYEEKSLVKKSITR